MALKRVCVFLILLALAIGSALVPLPRFAGLDFGLKDVSASTITWSGYDWTVENNNSPTPTGKNVRSSNVYVDGFGKLHLVIDQELIGGTTWWTGCQLLTTTDMGHGVYQWQIEGHPELQSEWVVLGLFQYPRDWSNPLYIGFEEWDFEYAKWGNPARAVNLDLSVNPAWDSSLPEPNRAYHGENVTLPVSDNSTHRVTRTDHSMTFEILEGHVAIGDPGVVIASWDYTPADWLLRIAKLDMPAIMNYWLYQGHSPGAVPDEMVITDFEFAPSAPASPFLIHDVIELQDMHDNLTGYYQLANNIDASGTAAWNAGHGWEPVGCDPNVFAGVLDGNGYSITDLTINRPDIADSCNWGGLFGVMNGATVYDLELIDPVITIYDYAGSITGIDGGGCTYENITITNPTILCTNAYAGGMIGFEETDTSWSPVISAVSNINNCHIVGGTVAMDVLSWPTLGGMLGWWSEGGIANSSSSAEVSVPDEVGAFMGGFSGWITSAFGPTYVYDCYSNGDVIGLLDTWGLYGGFAGWIEYSQVERCYSTGDVIIPVGNLVGGFTSYVYESDIDECYATGDIYGVSNLGGFCYGTDTFFGTQSTIDNCYATGNIYVIEDAFGGADIGGFIGDNQCGAIVECFSTGNIYIDNTLAVDCAEVGGFAGKNFSFDENATIQNCFSRGSISFIAGAEQGYYFGGFLGWNNNLGILNADIANCYSTGTIPAATGIFTDISGFCGLNDFGTITNCYWDIQTSNQATSDGGTGENTAAMKTGATFTGAGWDFASTWCMPDTGDNDDYPILQNTLLPGWACYAPLIPATPDAMYEIWGSITGGWELGLVKLLLLALIILWIFALILIYRSGSRDEI